MQIEGDSESNKRFLMEIEGDSVTIKRFLMEIERDSEYFGSFLRIICLFQKFLKYFGRIYIFLLEDS